MYISLFQSPFLGKGDNLVYITSLIEEGAQYLEKDNIIYDVTRKKHKEQKQENQSNVTMTNTTRTQGITLFGSLTPYIESK